MVQTKKGKTRDNVIDIARGACIIFMILTHVSGWWGKYQQFPKYTGVFFLVFFFFCSGMFYREPADKRRYTWKRFTRLEIPYIIVCLMVLVKRYYSGIRSAHVLINSFFYALPAEFESPYLLIGEMTTGIGPAWFLNCLFVSSCMYLALGLCLRGFARHRMVDGSDDRDTVNCNAEIFFKTALVIILAIVASMSQKYVVLPFNIQDGLVGVMFLHFGVLSAPYINRLITGAKKNTLKTAVFFIVILVIYYLDINYVPYQWLDLGSNKYNPQSLIGTCLGFLLLILGSVLLEKNKYTGNLISFIGQNSMIVLVIHAVDIDILRNWSRVSWPFVIATFAIYIGAAYVYVELKKMLGQKGTAKND